MKLRQKLAAVLAASIIATSIPVVTMAQSNNNLTHGIIVQEKNLTVTSGLKIEMKDAVDTTGAMFFVNLENSEWTAAVNSTGSIPNAKLDIQYKVNSKKELQVLVKAKLVDGDGNTIVNPGKDEFIIPVSAKLTGGDATIAVDGAGSVISKMDPVVFARTSEAKAQVTAGDAVAIYENGEVAAITVEESLKGTLTSGDADEDRTITLTLKNTDFEFTTEAITLELSRGFSDIPANAVTVEYAKDSNGDDDKQVLNVLLPKRNDLTVAGRIKFDDIQVNAKDPSSGSVDIEVSGKKVTKTTVKVAEVKNYGNTIEMEDKKVVEVVAGKKEKITFSINEIVSDSITPSRQIEVKLDKAYLATSNQSSLPSLTVKLNDTVLDAAAISAMGITAVKNDDDYITGFKFTPAGMTASKTDEITFEDVEVFVPLTTSGDVTISAEGRALVEEVSTTALTVKSPVQVTTEALTLKVGLKDQKGGKITIKETASDMLATKDLEIELPTESGLKFSTTKPVVKVTEGDLVLGEWKVENNKLIVAVKRASNTASTIEISDLVVSTDRTVPEGTYDIKVKGEALVKTADLFMDKGVADNDKNTIKVKDFIVMGTPNTEDLAANGLKKGIATFAIGAKDYTMNGVAQAMDGTPFISNGRTMVPVRYVANALGVSAKDIYFANGTVTVIAGNKTISLEVGNKVAKLNGVAARVMETAPVIKEGRTYVPVSEIGSLLGVNASWNGETKVATFENK